MKMPDNQDLKVKLAQILYQEQGKLEEAIELLGKVLEINAENHEALYLKGKIMLKKKEFKEAEDIIQQAIDVQEKQNLLVRSGIYFHLGQSQELQKEHEKAIQSF